MTCKIIQQNFQITQSNRNSVNGHMQIAIRTTSGISLNWIRTYVHEFWCHMTE